MATCERIQAHLNEFLDGTLGAVQAEELNAHLQECSACRAEYRALKATLEMVRSVTVPDGLESHRRVMARFRQAVTPATEPLPLKPAFRLPVWRARLVPLGAAAMTVALICLIGLPQLHHERSAPATGGPIVLATASCTTNLPTADDLDQMVSAHAVQSFTVQNGSEEPQQEALADANSRLR